MMPYRYRRIVFLIDSLGMGGAERLMVAYLSHFVATGFEPRVCALQVRDGNPVAQDIQQLGVPVDLLPVRHLRDRRAFPLLLRYLREHFADVLHTQLEFANTLGTVAAKVLGIPTVCTLHTMGNLMTGSLSRRVRAHLRHTAMQWSLKRFCDRVITVSEGTRQHYLRHGGFAPEQVMTIHNGISLAPFDELQSHVRQATREALGVPDDAPVLITVAVLRPQKGIQYMIAAMGEILRAVPGAYYLVVGDGEHEATLKHLAQEHGVTERVRFTGMRRDVPALLTASDVFVLPSMTEALPTVLAEAMAARRPIVASEVGGVPEMVEHGRNGLLVPPPLAPASSPPLVATHLAEACSYLLLHPEKASAMGQAGRAMMEQRFEIGRQAQRLGDLYRELLARRGK
ncbi:MAG: glycosyltransferase family 4 protein [Chloroflexaceae bacterium]|nr:glycosyltransferase family 4 protein [Chloroflexaceae bacterium]